MIRHGSLFSGIGGFDLAAEWNGWQNMFHCECNGFCAKILNHYWPAAEWITNITGYDWGKWKGKIDVLSGGWPCQKYSLAGKRTGDEPLKAEMLSAIQLIQPAWCVLENVYGFLTPRFAAEHALLCEQLENMGYNVQTLDLDAAGCGIPTLERHIWIIVAPAGQRLERNLQNEVQDFSCQEGQFPGDDPRVFDRWALPADRVCKLGEGVPGTLDTAAISEKKWHSESLMAFGNAIVPQMAYRIFKAIGKTMRY